MRVSDSKLSHTVWCAAGALSFWSFGYTMMSAGDLWWHLATGRLIFQTRALPLVDPWSFSRADAPWLQHEWLSDAIFHLWATAFGMAALVYWKWGVIILAFLTLMLTCRRLCKGFAPAYAAVVFGLAVAAPFLDIRPHLYTILGYALLLFLGLREGRALPLWLPVLFLFWVNLHGGFFFGLMALSIVVAASPEWRKNLRVLALSAAACLLNPNGVQAFLYPLRYAFDQGSPYRAAIAEWASPFKSGGVTSPLYVYALAAFLPVAGFFLWKRALANRVVIISLALCLLTMGMSLTSRRFIPLYAMSLTIPLSLVLAQLLALVRWRAPELAPPVVALALGLFLMWPYPKSPAAFHYLTAEDEFPVEVCNFIGVNGLTGNLFAYYNWGGYVHLRTAGRMRVFIDGRADTVYDRDTLLRYHQVQGFREGWQQVMETNGAEYILWPRDHRGRPFAELIQSGRWKLLYDDAVSVLLVRSDRAPTQPLQQTPDSGHKHLALGMKSFELQQFDQSEKELAKAVELLPASSFTCRLLTDLYLKQGKAERAAEQDRRCSKCFPTS